MQSQQNNIAAHFLEDIGCPIKGTVVPLSQVNNPIFSSGALGKGVAIIPLEGKVYSPITGIVVSLFESKHAIYLKSNNGIEILIHIGLDTANLNGNFYTTHIKPNVEIKKGQLLIDFDIKKILNEGYDMITPVIVTNYYDYKRIQTVVSDTIALGDTVIKVKK